MRWKDIATWKLDKCSVSTKELPARNMRERGCCSSAGLKKMTLTEKSNHMPDHEFEKNVKHRMEELRIPPSHPVWVRLDAELNRKEKRRRKIFWIPLSLAAASL